jgi:hypothetical protein
MQVLPTIICAPLGRAYKTPLSKGAKLAVHMYALCSYILWAATESGKAKRGKQKSLTQGKSLTPKMQLKLRSHMDSTSHTPTNAINKTPL